jgi:hypothetical protein
MSTQSEPNFRSCRVSEHYLQWLVTIVGFIFVLTLEQLIQTLNGSHPAATTCQDGQRYLTAGWTV